MEDLTGRRFNRLLVVKKALNRKSAWLCKCDCGNQTVVMTSRLLNGVRKSCGCLNQINRDKIGARSTTHGKTYTRLYHKWCGMKERCYNPNYKYFNRYGGRGIKVCNEWLHSFETFESWAVENGYDPNLDGTEQSIDRIDTNGDYEPSNCKWSTQKEQVRNRSNSVNFLYLGRIMNPYEFCELTGITDKVYVYRRLKKGDSPEYIIQRWYERHKWQKEIMDTKTDTAF